MDRQDKVAAAKATLEQGIASIESGDDWRKMLTGMANNARVKLSARRYSYTNQMLVAIAGMVMNVDSSSVATYKGWSKVGRNVKKGEKAVYILAPRPFTKEVTKGDGSTERRAGMFFRAMPVFLVGQTEGAELPPPPDMPKPVMPNDVVGFDAHLEKLNQVALGIEGNPVSSLSVRDRQTGDPSGANGWYVPATREIVVVRTDNQAGMFKTMLHEVAHSLMHRTEHHSYAWQEVEAESVAFIVSSVFGLDTSSYTFPYVTTWATADKTERNATKIVMKSGDRIVKAVNVILDALLGEMDSEPEADE